MRRSNDRTAATPMSIRRTVAWSRTQGSPRSGDVRRQGRSRQLGLAQEQAARPNRRFSRARRLSRWKSLAAWGLYGSVPDGCWAGACRSKCLRRFYPRKFVRATQGLTACRIAGDTRRSECQVWPACQRHQRVKHPAVELRSGLPRARNLHYLSGGDLGTGSSCFEGSRSKARTDDPPRPTRARRVR